MASTAQIAKTVRVAHSIPTSETDVSVLSRALIAKDGTIILDAEKLLAGDATQIAYFQQLLGGSGQIGSLKTIPAGQTIILDANSQDIVYGEFTVYGILKIYGEMRFGPWPF